MKRDLFIAGRWVEAAAAAVRSPFDGQVVAEVPQAQAAHLEEALSSAEGAREALQAQPTGQRQAILESIAQGISRRSSELISAIIQEAGKPRTLAEGEVARAVQTFRLAASALNAFGGEVVPVDLDARSAGYRCEVRRFPAGVIVGISPFNFPLNLAAHKVAPALAVGAPIILKPPPQAPSAALILAGIALEAGALPGAFSVVPCAAPLAEKMATDPRVRVLSFTGSARVGWHLRSLARGRVVLELGGNAAAVVCADADLDRAAEKIAPAAYAYAGQVCISVQRILVHTSVREAFLERLLARIRQLVVGDPDRRETVVGPLIDDASVERVERWVEAGLRAGGTCALRGARAGRVIDPILLCDVPAGQEVIDQEIFGPVAVVESFGELGEGLRRVNASRYGLQAGLFTRDLNIVRRAHEALEVGGLIVNDSPMFRSDAMPYGGVKDSGLGREGVRYAMEDFTEPRALVVAPP